MIDKLRNKIALINLVLMSLILLVALLVVFSVGFSRIQEESEKRMRMVLNGSITPEQLRYDETYFDVQLLLIDPDTLETEVIGNQNRPEQLQDIEACAKIVVSGAADSGYLFSMRCRYVKDYDPVNNVVRVAVLDGFAATNSFGRYTVLAVIATLMSLICFFVISYLLANIALKPIEESWNKQRQFVADASHELKTPISVIMANTDILMSHPEEISPDQMKWLENTRSEAERMKVLVQNLLFLAKNDAEATIQMEEVNLSDCAGKIALAHDAIFYESGKLFDYDITRKANVYGNEQQLKQLVTILLDNANKYSTGVGNVQLTLNVSGKFAVMRVSNDSAPLDEKQLEKLFDRFYTLDTAHNKNTSGNGLGLSIAKTICETHGGKIKALYGDNRMSFVVFLPLLTKKNSKKDLPAAE
ncbi:MAG: HAMP domain-containing histidine kinase [Corallococcus sp.]|nr:HAMP domain-containing histidine kinase [Corallococcus sp.]